MNRSYLTAVILFALVAPCFSQPVSVKGIIYDKDSVTPMPFAYVVDKRSASGVLSDGEGKFVIRISLGDTLVFSYLGYSPTKIYTLALKDSVKNSSLSVTVFLKQKATELGSVIISGNGFSKGTKEFYARKIDEYKRTVNSPFTTGPTGGGLSIDALYYALSKKGKELQKLSVLYQQILYDEIREHRLSNEVVRSITGNDTLDVKAFARHCYLPNEFIANASDYDLYYAVRRCYKEYCVLRMKKQ